MTKEVDVTPKVAAGLASVIPIIETSEGITHQRGASATPFVGKTRMGN